MNNTFSHGETIHISASYPANLPSPHPTIEILDPCERIIVEKSPIIAKTEHVGEFGDITFAWYDYEIKDDALLGEYKYVINIGGLDNSHIFEVVE